MSNQRSDAIVFFGASGDLAYKQIFPSLLRKELGDAKHPLHYLAIPPGLFAVVTEGLAKSRCASR